MTVRHKHGVYFPLAAWATRKKCTQVNKTQTTSFRVRGRNVVVTQSSSLMNAWSLNKEQFYQMLQLQIRSPGLMETNLSSCILGGQPSTLNAWACAKDRKHNRFTSVLLRRNSSNSDHELRQSKCVSQRTCRQTWDYSESLISSLQALFSLLCPLTGAGGGRWAPTLSPVLVLPSCSTVPSAAQLLILTTVRCRDVLC